MARARGFNLTAEINLRGPSNIRTVVADIRRQLGTVSVDINPRISPNTARTINSLNNALTSLNRTLNTTELNAMSAAQALGSLARAVNNIGGQGNVQALNNAANACQTINQNATRAAQGLNQAATGMEEFGRQSALAVRRFAAFSVVTTAINSLIGAVSNGIRTFIDFDKEFVRLQQVTGDSARGLQGLANQITSLSTSLGVASTDLTQVAVTLAQAGLSSKDTAKALEALAKSALAPSFDNMNQTVEGSIALMRQFGIGAGDLESALGSVNAVAAKFAVESGDLITAIQRTGGVFASSSKGVSEGKQALNEFLAVFTSVRATTRESAETIATGLRTIFTRVQRGGTIEALKEYGINLQDLEGKFVGPYEAVRRLSEGLKGLDPRDVRFSQIIEELGGFRQIGKVIPLIQQFATAQQALNVAQAGAGSLSKDAATAQLSLANQIAKVREEFLALIRSIGEDQSFRSFIRLSLDLASALIKVADSAKGLLPALTALAAIRGISALTQFGAGFVGGLGGGRRRGFASGGMVPGSGNGDTVPAMLTPGEFVIRKKAVQAIGVGNLHGLNRYADGGLVQYFAQTTPTPGSGRVLTGADVLAQRRAALKEAKKSGSLKKPRQLSEGFPFGLAALYGNPYRKTLKGPKSKQNITLIGGSLPKNLSDQYQNQSITGFKKVITDVGSAMALSIGASAAADDNKLNQIIKNTGLGNIVGSILEASLGVAGSPFIEKTRESSSIDFPAGLGLLAKKFGLPPGIPTDATRTMETGKALRGKTVTDFLNQADRFLVQNQYSPVPGTFANGGSVDTVPAMLTPGEFVINKRAASRLGSSTLNRLNKADKISGFNKGGSVGGIQHFADGGEVFSGQNLAFAGAAIAGLVAIFLRWGKILPLITTNLGRFSTAIRTSTTAAASQGLTAPTAAARAARASGLRGDAFRDRMRSRSRGLATGIGGFGAIYAGQLALDQIPETEEKPSMLKRTLGGALSSGLTGATIGSAFGPWGTAIGGIAGAAYGAIQGLKDYQAALDENTKKNREAIRPEEAAQEAIQQLVRDSENLADVYRKISINIERFSLNLEEYTQRAGNIPDILSGKGAAAPSKMTSALAKNLELASLDETRFIAQQIRGASGGSAKGNQLAQTLVASKIIRDVLPGILRNTNKSAGPGNTVRDQLKQALGGNITPEIIKILDDIDDRIVNNPSRDDATFAQLADQEIGNILGPTIDAAQQATQQITEAYINALTLLTDATKSYTDSIIAAQQAQFQAQKIQIDAGNNLKKALGGTLSLGELNAGANLQTRQLTGGLIPGGSLDPAQITQAIIRTTAQTDQLETRRRQVQELAQTATGRERQALMAEYMDLTATINFNSDAVKNGTQALEDLASSGNGASNVLQKLQERQQRSLAAGSQIDQLITGGPQARLEFMNRARSFQAGRAALEAGQGAQYFGGNQQRMSEFLEGLKAFEGMLSPDIVSRLKEQFYGTIIPKGVSLPGLGPGATSDTLIKDIAGVVDHQDALVKQYYSAIDAQTAAAQGLATIHENITAHWLQVMQAQGNNIAFGMPAAINAQPRSRGGIIYASDGAYVKYEPKGTDTIPAMLSEGEFVVNARATSKHLPLLKAINRANGGQVNRFRQNPAPDRIPGTFYTYGTNLYRAWNPFADTTIDASESGASGDLAGYTTVGRFGTSAAYIAGIGLAGIGAAGALGIGGTGASAAGVPSVVASAAHAGGSGTAITIATGPMAGQAVGTIGAGGSVTAATAGAGVGTGVAGAVPVAAAPAAITIPGLAHATGTVTTMGALGVGSYAAMGGFNPQTAPAPATAAGQPAPAVASQRSSEAEGYVVSRRPPRKRSTNRATPAPVPDFNTMISNVQTYGTPNPTPAEIADYEAQRDMDYRLATADDTVKPTPRGRATGPGPLSMRMQRLAARRIQYRNMMASRRAKFAAANPNYRRARVRNNIYSATGGLINRGSDTIPAMLTPGEFVVNKDATNANRSLLHHMNRGGKVRYYQNGGDVGVANNGPMGGMMSIDSASQNVMSTFATTLSSFSTSFGSYIDKLSNIKIPDKIEMVGRHTVEVSVTGAAAFEAIEAGVKQLINTEIGKKMDMIWNQSGGKLGQAPLANSVDSNAGKIGAGRA